MKTTLLFCLAFFIVAIGEAQIPVLYYDFENNTTRTTGEITVEQSVNAGASNLVRLFSGGTPTITYPAGAGVLYGGTASGSSFSSNRWATSDPGTNASNCYGFNTSTAGYSGLTLSFDALASQSGMSVGVSWSADNQTFTAASTAPVTIPTAYSNLQFVIPAGAENLTTLYIRIYAYGASAFTSTFTIDNLALRASTITASKTLLDYAAVGLSQASGTVNDPAYTNFTITGSGTVATLGGRLRLQGALNLTGGTLSLGASTLLMNGTISQSAGVINAVSGTISYGGSVGQTVLPAHFTGAIHNLTINNNSGVTAGGNLTVSNALTLTSGTFNIGSTVLTLSATASRNTGVVNAALGTILFNGSAAQTISSAWFTGSIHQLLINNVSGVSASGNLTIDNTLTLSAGAFLLGTTTLTVKGNITRSAGWIDATSASVVFNGSAAQSISASAFSGSVMSLVINNAAGVTTSADFTITGTLALSGGTFNITTSTLTMQGTINANVGQIDVSAGSLIFSGSTAQTITAASFLSTVKNLTINNSAGVTTSANTTITGTLTLTAGTYTIGSTTHTITGIINRTAGMMDASSGSLIFNGSEAQAILTGSIRTNIGNLTINNTNGVTINDDYTISSALVLQTGFLSLNGKSLTIGGTVSGPGTFRGSGTSNLTITSAVAAGTLNFDQTTDGSTNALASFAITSGGATLGSKLHLYLLLNIAGGTLDLAAKNLVLKSSQSQTAMVTEIKGTLIGETNVSVERYTPAWSSRRWRLVTAPVLNTTINAAWQEGGRWNGSAALSATGNGTLITGAAQGSATAANTNGFDFWTAIAGASSSIRTYVSVSSSSQANWNPVTSTLTTGAFDQHQAYLLFIRGDRSVSAGTAVGSTTLRPTGTLKKGSFTIDVPATKSHTVLGNPYAAPLDFKAVYDANSTKIQPCFWTWQASLGTGTGGYVLVQPVSPGSQLYEVIPDNGSQSAANRLIHSGEGFFVVPATSASGTNSITIQEGHKSTGSPGVAVFRQQNNAPAKLYINVTTPANGTSILLDGALAQYSETGEGANMVKASNSTENLSIHKGGSDVIVATGAVPKVGDRLQLRLWNTASKTYQFEIRSASFADVGLTAVLVDRFAKTETILNLNEGVTPYTFSITADAASKDPLRFYIEFKAGQTLALAALSLQAEEKTNGVQLQWRVTDESGIAAYELEKAEVGMTFTSLAILIAKKGRGEQVYTYLDRKPAELTYYRIKIVKTSGAVTYSSVVKVHVQTDDEAVKIYPNPVSGSSFSVHFINKPPGNYTITLYNMAGQAAMSKILQHKGGNTVEVFSLAEAVVSGSYKLRVVGENNKNEWTNLVIQK
jgi:hypothetical protein